MNGAAMPIMHGRRCFRDLKSRSDLVANDAIITRVVMKSGKLLVPANTRRHERYLRSDVMVYWHTCVSPTVEQSSGCCSQPVKSTSSPQLALTRDRNPPHLTE